MTEAYTVADDRTHIIPIDISGSSQNLSSPSQYSNSFPLTPALRKSLEIGARCNNAHWSAERQTWVGQATDVALVSVAAGAGIQDKEVCLLFKLRSNNCRQCPMKSIKNYRKSFHDHDPSWHEHNRPTWNSDVSLSGLYNSLTLIFSAGPSAMGFEHDGETSTHGTARCRIRSSTCATQL